VKVIISHDVDHISAGEHWADLTIPKFMVRTLVEKLRGGIATREISRRLHETFVTGKWQNIDELMQFDREHGVQSTFFVGVNQGLGLSYPRWQAEYWMKKILQSGFEVGVHGICFDKQVGIEREYLTFSKLSGLQNFGIRMHYLRKSSHTLELLAQTGYLYDTTCYEFAAPFKVGDMIEFPLQIRESRMLYPHSTFCTVPLNEAMDLTKRSIDLGLKARLPYLTILFHDRYFSHAFVVWREWYIWLIEYLQVGGISFIDYRQAVKENFA